MKKIALIIVSVIIGLSAFGQSNTYVYPFIIGLQGFRNGQITLNGLTSGTLVLRPNGAAGTGTIFQFPNTNGTSGYLLTTDGAGITSWTAPGASMVYPGAGIPLSTGSAWGTSITNASANWNTAYGWGNHASAGYLTTQTSHTDVVVDGDFISQGIVLRGVGSGTYSILTDNSANWNTAYGWGNHAGLYDPLNTASGLISTHNSTYTHTNIANGQTAFGWGNHAIAGYAPSSHSQAQTTITALPDSLLARYTKTQTNTRLNLKENSLGNPGVTGYVLSSTDAGVRSWVAQSAGYTNLTSFVAQTNWRVFYSNGSGDVTELALGADGTYLKSNGAAVAPTFSSIAGGGDVTKVATPLNDQVGVWTGDGTLEGTTGLTYSGTNLQLTGDIGATGTRITKGWFTDLTVTNAIAGAVTGNAGTVTGFAPAGGSLTLAGADAVTLTTSAATSLTLPTSGMLTNKQQVNFSLDSLISGGELAVALSDSGVYNKGYMTPRGTDVKLALKANIASPTFTGTVGGITYTMVGAAASSHNQAQTTITALPDSLLARYTKTQANTKLDLKANLASPTFTGTVVLPSTTSIGNVSNTEIDYVNGVTSAIQTQLSSKVNLAPDTVQHTANYTVAASDYGKDQHLRKATSMIITLPPSLTEWPVGGIINFYGGVGITVFKKGSGVVFESPLDSIATSAKYEGVTVKKVAASKYKLIGALKD